MSAPQPICVVGAGLAGSRAVFALRKGGFEGRVLLLGAEEEPPYDRPPLSKEYLMGRMDRSRLLLLPPTYYRDQAIEWHGGTRVVEIHRGDRRLVLSDGRQVTYQKLLLTTGSDPSTLDLPGSELEGVGTVRDLSDADELRSRLLQRPRVLVIGAGFLGCELAAVARELGCPVVVAEAGPAVMSGMGAEASAFITRLHRERGVDLRCSTAVLRLHGRARVEAASLSDATRVDCDLVLMCVGARPRTELAVATGLRVSDGILTDSHCRTSDPAIFAAGDVARFWHPGLRRRIRLEHWDNAQRQGLHAGAAMLGSPALYQPLPYFWSEQYDSTLQRVGIPGPHQTQVNRGDPLSSSFSIVYLNGPVVTAWLAVNRVSELTAARRLIGQRTEVDPQALARPATDLQGLAQSSG
ncbi:MAG TPA: FAD-dependent oxidoreductase [Candidatus Dormibacteraeota bacterium]|nr:FAD-dependent oxidoreductase [Candidatus Dormibacteraeota bacterium]